MSNWYSSQFNADFLDDKDLEFPTVEHYMMYNKAQLFEDTEIANQILAASHPKQVKALGRKVRNFDIDIWSRNCERIVYEGCLMKFQQNSKLAQQLIDTGNKILVEAAHYDKIWGIGLRETHPDAIHPEKWPGNNLLGQILMSVRKSIK